MANVAMPDRPTVIYQATEHHRRSANIKLYCWLTDTDDCDQLA